MRLLDKLFAPMIDRRIEAFESDLISRQCEEVETMYRTMRGWRHDYHNHIQTLLALAGDENEAVKNYLLDLNHDLTTVDTVIRTGNVMVDAILNSKLTLIREKRIEVNAKAVVPKNLSVSEIDLCSMLGNLLEVGVKTDAKEALLPSYVIYEFLSVHLWYLFIVLLANPITTTKAMAISA